MTTGYLQQHVATSLLRTKTGVFTGQPMVEVSWERVLFVSDSTSAIDIVQHPTNPDILYAAMWERMRGLNYRRSFGATSGIWKTTDGGDTWTELTTGLPQGDETGRIGLAISPVFAITTLCFL